MALELNAFAVLQAISDNPSTFSNIRSDAIKASSALVTKVRKLLIRLLKAKAADVAAIRNISKAIGSSNFNHLVDGLGDADLKAIISKVDKHHPEQKDADSNWLRLHLLGLAEGKIEPMVKVPKLKKFLSDESAGAVRKKPPKKGRNR